MRHAAIIENNKILQIVDIALYKPTKPVSMVNIDRYDVMVGDDYTGGKFYRDGVEIQQDPKPMEMKLALVQADEIIDDLIIDNLSLTEAVDDLILEVI